jgi:hypothetical protein
MRSAVAVVALAVLSTAGANRTVAQASPAEVAATFFKAVAEERWRDAARELDLTAVDRYRRERIAAARLPQLRPRPMTVDEYLRHNPDVPRAVAEYHVRGINEARFDPDEWVIREFANVSHIDSLAALSAHDAAARWLQAQDLRWMVRLSEEEQRKRGCVPVADAAPSVPAPRHEILGMIIADSTTAYVLYREAALRRAEPDVDAAVDAEPPHVLTLRRRGGTWRLLPRRGMLFGAILGAGSLTACTPRERPPR